FDALMCLKLLDRMKLRRVVFEQGFTEEELSRVVAAFGHVKAETITENYWPTFCTEQGLERIQMFHGSDTVRGRAMPLLRDMHAVSPEQAALTPDPALPAFEPERPAAAIEPDEALPDFLKNAAQRLMLMTASGDRGAIGLALQRLGRALRGDADATREQAVGVCRDLLRVLPVGFHEMAIRGLADGLTKAVAEERQPPLLSAMASLAHRMAGTAIQFDDHGLATRLFASLSERRREFEPRQDAAARALVRSLDLRPDPAVEKVLMEDLKSGDVQRHERAAQVLGALGPSIAPVLVDLIKHEEALRPRQLAARVLAEQGARGIAVFKRELVVDMAPVQLARMLEVADLVTPTLRTELLYALGESNAM